MSSLQALRLDQARPQSLVGAQVGRYRITRELARGGMGVVYEAVHQGIGHRAAVKVLASGMPKDKKGADYAGRFFDEARAVNIVQHPGIVQIFDFGTLPDDTVYIMMEYLEGEPLWDRMQRLQRAGQRIPLPDALRICRLIASALHAAHGKRIIHRDLKPENVILVQDPDVPGEERTKVLDFGIARFLDAEQRRTVAGMVMGTAIYMAPEQCSGADQLDGKVDVYALGVMLYEMLAGRPPFDAGDASRIMVLHVKEAPPPIGVLLPGLPEPTARLVHRMLEKRPAARPTMAEVVVEIRQLETQLLREVLSTPRASSPFSATVHLPTLAAAPAAPAAIHQATQMLGATRGSPTRTSRSSLMLALLLALIPLVGLAAWWRSTSSQPQRRATVGQVETAPPQAQAPLLAVQPAVQEQQPPPQKIPVKRAGAKRTKAPRHRGR